MVLEVEAAREERKRRLVGQEELVTRIERLLFESDPIGIGFREDEYRVEAETITIRLPEAFTETELLRIVYEEFVEWFDESTAGPMLNYAPIASEIWALQHGPSSAP